MFWIGELKTLGSRKAELLAKSAATREELLRGCAKVLPTITLVNRGTQFIRRIGPVGLMAGRLLRMWSGRNKD